MTSSYISIFLLTLRFFGIFCTGNKAPHIIVIVADDLGWNDVGFHGSNQIPTPNIDALSYGGIILNNYYVDPICTPSRSALMTGLHPIHSGMQLYTIPAGAPYGLPLNIKILPEYLNDLGYKSHAVGKWHLGSFKAEYTPTFRGFHSHMGYWTGREDYYSHSSVETLSEKIGWGYDFRRNMSVNWKDYGTYATSLFTNEAVSIISNHNASSSPLFMYLAHLAVHSANPYDPIQTPIEEYDLFPYINDTARRKFAGVLTHLDRSVGSVVTALKDSNMLSDSIVVFTTDNGGPAGGFNSNAASNWPLRGVKDTLWEGGVRGASFLWSPKLKSKSLVSQALMNIQDWLPTLYFAAGGKVSDLPPMDGMNLWNALSKNDSSPRNIMVHNIDEPRKASALRVGKWKYIRGNTYKESWDDWYGPSGRSESYNLSLVYDSGVSKALTSIGYPLPSKPIILSLRNSALLDCKNKTGAPCHTSQSVCLFDIENDPCELNNVAFQYSNIIQILDDTLNLFRNSSVEPQFKPSDMRSNPIYWNYTWTNWMDKLKIKPISIKSWTRPVLLDTTLQEILKKKYEIY